MKLKPNLSFTELKGSDR